jgi:hypothetical protein
MRGMLTSGFMLLHNCACRHTTAHTGTLLENLIWILSDHRLYSSDHIPTNYNLFAYLKNWLRSQPLKNNEFMEDVKTWCNSHAQTSSTQT